MAARIGALTLVAALAHALVHAPTAAARQAPDVPMAAEFENLHFRSIGPATMSGRISDLAVYERNPAVWYVGTAHGGVWKTTSNGALFEPLFQDEGLISIGDVTVSQSNPDLVWVGAGEANNRQSTSWGGGVWKSIDGGKTFQRMGLERSRHINRIVIDPTNPDIVLVAATGPLFGSGGDRGIYKTTDGGRTWKNVLRVDEETGANDLVMATTDARILFASTYQRRRNACCMNGGGAGSGVWKSADGGDTWTRLSAGLPAGPLGRIAVDVFRKNANTVYALIEGPGGGQRGRGGEDEEAADTAAAGRGAGGGRGGRGGDAEPAGTGIYRSDDGGATWTRASATNPRPMYFSQVRIDPTDPDVVYLGGVGLHMTVNGGRTFETDAAQAIHDDVHAIWIDPDNPQHILIGNDGGLAVSWDRSSTWTFFPNLPVGLFYHVGYDMEIPYNICGGMQDNYNWCGPSASRHNRGIMNYDWFQIQGGDGFVAVPDLRDARIVYTESQGGNMIRRNKVTGESKSIRPSALNVTNAIADETYRFSWDTPLLISPSDPGVLFAAAQRVFRSTDRGDSWTAISPDLTTGADRDTIATMGVRNSDIRISRNDGISSWPTIVSLAESPKQAGILYAGTDDGVVSVSRDGGAHWQDITRNLPGFPAGGWVSEVVPSRFEAGRVYVTVDNHLDDDFGTYMWVSDDFGASFRSIRANLHDENVRTLTEDQRNPDVLYIGSETGVFLSLDRGRSWRRLKANLPTVRVDEITLHPRDNAMLVATHGRALFVLDHLEPIQESAAVRAAGAARLFTIPTALEWKAKDDRNDEFWGHQFFAGENPPVEAIVQYHLPGAADDVKLRVSNDRGTTVREITAAEGRRAPGIQTLCWDLRYAPIPPARAAAAGGAGGRGGAGGGRGDADTTAVPGVPTSLPSAGYRPADPCDVPGEESGRGGGRGGFGGGPTQGPYVAPGTYQVALIVNGRTADTKPLRVIMDPAVPLSGQDRVAYDALLLDLHELQRRGTAAASSLDQLHAQLDSVAAKVQAAAAVPAAVKSDVAAFRTAFDAVRVKFGVPLAAPGAGGRGGGRGNTPDPANVLARTAAIGGSIQSFWERPAPSLVRQYESVKPELEAALREADDVLGRARTLSQTLGGYDIALAVPPPDAEAGGGR